MLKCILNVYTRQIMVESKESLLFEFLFFIVILFSFTVFFSNLWGKGCFYFIIYLNLFIYCYTSCSRIFSPLPTKSKGTSGLDSVRLSVRQSCKSVFRTFLFMLSDIHLIFGVLLWHIKIQIKFEFGVDPLIFQEVMALGLRKYHEFSVFRTFFLMLSDINLIFGILLWNIRYRSSLSLMLIHWFFRKLWPLDFEKYLEFSVFRTFLFVLNFRYIFIRYIRYIALTYQDTDQVWVWFWSIDFSRGYDPWTSKNITKY
jgi:hypothetical protein